MSFFSGWAGEAAIHPVGAGDERADAGLGQPADGRAAVEAVLDAAGVARRDFRGTGRGSHQKHDDLVAVRLLRRAVRPASSSTRRLSCLLDAITGSRQVGLWWCSW